MLVFRCSQHFLASCVLRLMLASLLLSSCSMQFALILIQTKTFNIPQFGIHAHGHTLTGRLAEAEPCILHVLSFVISLGVRGF